MTLLDAFWLGLVQGLTEFLPVSSSGHLVLAGRVLHLTMSGVAFEIWLHVATLTAVVAALWRDIAGILRGILPGARPEAARRAWTLTGAIVLGTLPAVAVGLLAKDAIEAAFTSVRMVGIDLLLTAVILSLSRLRRPGDAPLTLKRGFLIGVAQAVAILPGVSRSGSPLAAGSLLGLRGAEAARFSFLLSLPAILGAVVLDAKEVSALGQGEPLVLAVGFVTAAVSGYFAIRVMWRVMERGRLALFAPYCAVLGIAAILLGGVVPR